MPYNYPYNFYSNVPMPTNPVNTTQQPNRTGINWVAGVEGLKEVKLQPNNAVLLLDSDNEGVFYIKSCDNIGICTVRTFMYEEVTQPTAESKEYITKNEFNQAIEELKGLIKSE